ncbi:MAG TPA: NUDIX hydrolase [Actinomycetota bacterium]|nr:NUDIX hydrolase [Actinomycetota bacterium]
MRERVLGSRTVFSGRILSLRVDEVEAADGHRSTREVIEHGGAVGMVVVHDGEVVLVRQYRHATGEVLLEIPAGRLEPGEEPEATARREMVEEVGLRAHALEHLATYYTAAGFSNELFHLYLAQECEPAAGETDEGEVLEVVRHPVGELDELISSGEVRDAKSLIGLLMLARRR